MKALRFSLLLYTTAIVITLRLLVSPVVCFNHKPPSDTTRGLQFEEQERLGSTPPSCHNKCNQCHPCMAVQIPSLRGGHNQLQPGRSRGSHNEHFDSSALPLATASYKYSNYKPLGWKCTCGDHFFNP